MIRVKSDIELKELEKFEFKQVVSSITNKLMPRWVSNSKSDYIIICDYGDFQCGVDTGTRIPSSADWSKNNNLDILYDLIQAGLMEKIE